MTRPVMLDTGPLGRIAHPRQDPEMIHWLYGLVDTGTPVLLPEIVDYELRRSFLLENLTYSLSRLDRLKESLIYLPLTTEVMLLAAQLWANLRRKGLPTADLKALDCDVILGAQALCFGAVVATENIRHLSRLVDARHWRDIS